MRVLHLLKTSAGATWAYRQMRELVKLGVEVHAAMPGGGEGVELCEEAGIVVHLQQFDLPVRRPWSAPELLRGLRSLVSTIRPDIVHSHFVGTTLTMRVALRDVPVPRIFQVPGPLHLEHALFRNGELRSSTADDYWIATCEWTRQRYLRSGVSGDRIFLSYYGTDLDLFAGEERVPLREELSIPETTWVVGMVAYIYAPKYYLMQTRGLKGHEDLIDAVALCRRRGLDVAAVFVGGPWGRAAGYARRVQAYGARRCGPHAFFLGTRGDVPALYRSFDLVVHPSHSENVGGASESLLLGVPTVATDVGGFPDVVVPGQTGWLVPPQSVPRLADAIQAVLADPGRARAYTAEGQRRMRQLFDVRRTAREVLGIYERIARPR